MILWDTYVSFHHQWDSGHLSNSSHTLEAFKQEAKHRDHFEALQVQEVLIPKWEPKFPGRKYTFDVFVSRAKMRRQSFLITYGCLARSFLPSH